MIVKGNKPIFFNLHSSFAISEGDTEEDNFSIRKGACFSSSGGEAFSIEDGDIELDKIEAGKSVHLGIRRDKASFNPVEARLYYGEEKESKKEDEENAWTWVELIDEDGSISSLDNDIILPKANNEPSRSFNFFLEEHDDQIVVKISDNFGRTAILEPSKGGDFVIIEDENRRYKLKPLASQLLIENNAELPVAIVNTEKRLIVPL